MPVFRCSLHLLAMPLALALLTGCATTNPCGDDSEYLTARDRPRLQMPEGISGSERLGTAMVVPPAGAEPTKLDPQPRCLDEPPAYFAPKKTAAGGSAEEAVLVWAAAWANAKPDQVAAFYSPQFETTDPGGAAAFVDQRKQQVASGRTPDLRLEEMKTTTLGRDRSMVSFIQRFGDGAVRKELTLARDAQGWRIIAERTVEVL